MNNKEIAQYFTDLANIMELHGENPFKIRSYQNAYVTLRKLDTPLSTLTRAELEAIKGVGKNIADKILELLETQKLSTYEQYATQTPEGVRDMLRIKGLGVKKIQAIWKDLGIETVGELIYACNENRLVELHGFGKKTQEEIRKNAEYFLQSRHQWLWAEADEWATAFEQRAKSFKLFENFQLERVGALRRLMPTVSEIAFLTDTTEVILNEFLTKNKFSIVQQDIYVTKILTAAEIPLHIYKTDTPNFGSKLFRYSAEKTFLDEFLSFYQKTYPSVIPDFRGIAAEKTIFEQANLPFIAPELRDLPKIVTLAADNHLPKLITIADIRGVVHAHSTYSDGLNSLEDMANAAQKMGFSYLAISDHSKAAFYANGLKEEQLFAQWNEIDALNQQFTDFKILKGIESDILADGSLDYSNDILSKFDFIIASVHSNLKMDEAKATTRLIKAIENPRTTILGHPTGRLLLARKGYPIDFQKVIDACAANNVAIELNANPYRLDLDWAWIPYALSHGVRIAINPDAHSCEGIKHLTYGINAARKGGLTAAECLNSLSAADFLAFAKK